MPGVIEVLRKSQSTNYGAIAYANILVVIGAPSQVLLNIMVNAT